MKYLLVLLALLPAQLAQAKGYCPYPYKTYQTSHSLQGWNATCMNCHPKPRGWKEIVADAALEQKRRDGAYADNQQFFDEMNKMGLSFKSGIPNYGLKYGASYGHGGHYGANYYVPSAGQGSTITATTTETVTTNPLLLLDLNVAMNNATRLAEQSLAGGQEARNGLMAWTSDMAAALGEAAKTNAQRDLAVALAQVTRPAPTTRTTTTTQSYRNGIPVPPSPLNPAAFDAAAELAPPTAQLVINARCVSCHNPTKPTKGLDLSDITRLSPDQRGDVLKRIVNPDPLARMPFALQGPPGVPLTAEECSAIFRDKEFAP